ncbi:MAG: hypothetical protein ABIA04_14210 [Pseudomonadota bacterium]
MKNKFNTLFIRITLMIFSILLFSIPSFSEEKMHDHSNMKANENHSEMNKDRIKLDETILKSLETVITEDKILHDILFNEKLEPLSVQVNIILNKINTTKKLLNKSHEKLTELLLNIEKDLKALNNSKLHSSKLEHFGKANQKLIQVLMKYEVSKEFNGFYCTMAKMPWIDKGKEVKNPYYPKKMPKCGTLVYDAKKE